MEERQPSANPDQQALPATVNEVPTTQNQDQDNDSAECCVICLDPVSELCETAPCQHRNFDYPCLLSWLKRSPRCPLCNTTVNIVRHALDQPTAKIHVVSSVPQPRVLEGFSPFGSAGVPTILYSPRPRPPRPPRPRARIDPTPPSDTGNGTSSNAIARRREIYRNNQYSKHVGSNRVSQYRELTPAMFCDDRELVSRARMWIRRELQVFSFLTLDEEDNSVERPEQDRTVVALRRANNAEFLLEYIIGVLKSVDMMGSVGQAEAMISDFLGRESTRLFLHELRAWLRSPYTKLEDWDRNVQYDEPTAGSSSIAPRPSAEEIDGELSRHETSHRNQSGSLQAIRPQYERFIRTPAYHQRRAERRWADQQRMHRQMQEHLRVAQRRVEQSNVRRTALTRAVERERARLQARRDQPGRN